MPHLHNGAVEPDSDRNVIPVQLAVIRFCRDDVLHRRAGDGVRNERAHEQSRYGGIAIRKMKDVWFTLFRGRQTKPLKPRISERFVVVAGLVTSHCRDRFDADAEKIVRESLEKWESIKSDLAMLGQVIRIANFIQSS